MLAAAVWSLRAQCVECRIWGANYKLSARCFIVIRFVNVSRKMRVFVRPIITKLKSVTRTQTLSQARFGRVMAIGCVATRGIFLLGFRV